MSTDKEWYSKIFETQAKSVRKVFEQQHSPKWEQP